MTTRYTLVLPTRLTTKRGEAFAGHVLFAASVAGVTVELVIEDSGHDDLEVAKAYGLPALVVHESNANGSVLFQSRAAVIKLLGAEIENGMDALCLEDKLEKIVKVGLEDGKTEDLEWPNLTIASEVDKILVAGYIWTLLRAECNVPANVKDWFEGFASTNSSQLSCLEPHLLQLSQRRVKVGTCLVYDWSEERLPKREKRNVLITAALPYVNNVPHLGNIIGAVLSADVFARYCRLRDYQTLFICGTDEYGTATETKALEEGISCAELCAKYFKLHAAIYDWFGIATDIFGRSSSEKQKEITHEIFKSLNGNGYFFEQSVDQTFCDGPCQRFLADRYVEGTCPLCGFDDARGDQCDGCGKLINPTELKNPKCKICRNPPIIKSSNHLFLDLTKLQPSLEGWLEKQTIKGHWSTNSASISRAWLTEGLKPRCMTRDLRWGTSVPLPGFEDKVFYVWFDACFGYISITANYTEEWRKWWQAGEGSESDVSKPKVELFQFMGKDNVPFHTVIFPSSLLGTVEAGESCPWTLLHHINTTEYLNYESGKFSKSRGIGVFGNDARDSGIPVSVWRYYLLSVRPETTDSVFSWEDFGARNNSELLANLGNFVNRVTKFAVSKLGGQVPKIEELNAVDKSLLDKVNAELKNYLELMEGVHLRGALKTAMAISSLGNHYLTEAGLDGKLLASDPSRCGTIIAIALNLSYLLSALLDPFIPATAADIRRILNAPVCRIPDVFEIDVLSDGHVLGLPFHLFVRIEESKLTELRSKFSGKQVK